MNLLGKRKTSVGLVTIGDEISLKSINPCGVPGGNTKLL